jgi:hypothetical protein
VLVLDVNNNGLRVNVTIGQPSAALALTVNAGTISTNGGTTSVTLGATGGTAPYTFSGPTSNVRAGTYTYVVTDVKGCTDSRVVTIGVSQTALMISAIQQKDDIGSGKISIKNMTSMIDLTITNPHMEDVIVNLVDMNGRSVRMMKFNKSTSSLNTKISMSDLPNGTYIISITSPHIKHAKQVIKL